MLCSRSAHDLIELDRAHPGLARRLELRRPLLAAISRGVDTLREALDAERRRAMDEDEGRIRAYLAAASGLERAWLDVVRRTAGLPLRRAHALVVDCAERCLPTSPERLPPATGS
jgi:hypothetical protein